MKHILIGLLAFVSLSLGAQQININSWNSVRNMQNPCDSVTAEIVGDMDATYAQGAINVSIKGFTIEVEIIKIYGFATQPVSPNISWSEQVELGVLPVGTYTMNVTAKLSTVTYGFKKFTFTIDHSYSILTDTTICFGDSIMLDAKVDGMLNPTYSWSNGKQTRQSYFSTPGTITVLVKGSNCNVQDTMMLNFTDSIAQILGNDTAVCLGDSIILGPGPLIYSYKWKDNSTGNVVVWNFPVQGTETIWLDVTDSNACTSHQEITVIAEDCDTAVTSVDQAEGRLNIDLWPNPTDDILYISGCHSQDNIQFIVVDSRGSVVMQEEVASISGRITLNVVNLPSGVYMLRALSGNSFATKRFVKK